ncbi:MAG: family 16 glycosylhydrolase [Candidatus Cloacimonadaceae bacterium]|nr:family 16 glycosylhydrolase [Candidatus Cloacimonadaceae bacterium]
MARKTLTLIFFASLLILIGCDKISAPQPVPDVTTPANYTLIWADEFEQRSTSPDSDKWSYDLGYGENGWGNDEWQLYTNNLQNVRVENGNLVISAVWDSINYPVPGKRNGSITSARINTKNKFSFKYGKVQARIKIPTDMGMWPAFWMLGKNYDTVGWPQCGEIDIMEASPLYHNARTSMCTVHWWDDPSASHRSFGKTIQLSSALSNDYHVYEVEWDAQRIVGKIDGIPYFVKVIDPATMDEFLREFFLIFNVAVGGNLGGTPDASTHWPQSMMVDWVRVYQKDESLIPIETFGIFTDETPVDAGLVVGVDAEIYVWENTLTGGTIPPYEGPNVISWTTTGVGWFGAGIKSNSPIDLSTFAEGNIKFMIKIPANVRFKIGINDTQNTESYVTFPANQTAYGLVRNGEWGQAVIPVSAIKGNVDLQTLNYEFIILEENGTQCQFAIDDIYWDGGGSSPSSVSFDMDSYAVDAANATISVNDAAAAGNAVSVSVTNGSETISVGITLGQNGAGSGLLSFGPTNDATNTIAITAGGSITVSYTDTFGTVRTDTANITGGGSPDAIGIYSETHTNPMLPYSQIINSADWSGNPAEPNLTSTAVTPVDGTYVLAVTFADIGAGWGGIAFNFGAQDISAYSTFVINLNKSAMPNMAHFGIKFEDNTGGNLQVDLASYTPVLSGPWAKYEIPMSHFAGVNLSAVKYLGLWNPTNSGNAYLVGTLYFDDIHLKN